MTLNEALIKCDLYCSNNVEKEVKIDAISSLEARLIKEVLNGYTDVPPYDKDFKKYDAEQDAARELLAPTPYDEMYAHYAAAQVYLILHEQKHYNNELYIFNSILADYKAYLSRNYHSAGVSRYRVR